MNKHFFVTLFLSLLEIIIITTLLVFLINEYYLSAIGLLIYIIYHLEKGATFRDFLPTILLAPMYAISFIYFQIIGFLVMCMIHFLLSLFWAKARFYKD
jgi:hypothetical protein